MAIARTDPRLLAVARGDAPADLLLSEARIVNVFTRQIEDGAVAIAGGRIASIGPPVEAKDTIKLNGAFIAPGFIDAHMHIESTMMLPGEFARIALPRGTTGVVLDPHEIANVSGIAGICALIDLARPVPMHMRFAASSCVPASSLESSGASLSADDLRPLFDDPLVVALAEMMNFPGVVNGDPDVLDKVRLGLNQGVVDGHCPGLSGPGLEAYIAAGPSSDHECVTAQEAMSKIRLGMFVYIREGSAARNLDALLPAVEPSNAHRFCFCTDDRNPTDLADQGHIDHVIRRAIALGLDPATAIAMASLHPAEHYGFSDRGAVAPGRLADLVVFDDLTDMRPRLVYVAGELVGENGRCVTDIQVPPDALAAANALRDSVHIRDDLDASSLLCKAGSGNIRVIGMHPDQIVTDDLRMTLSTTDGIYTPDLEQDLLKLAVIERHHNTGRIGLGFVRGFQLQHGALGSTVGHDAHNLAIVGTNDTDMIVAAKALAETGGGLCAVRDGTVMELVPLPIAGLLSDQSAEALVKQHKALLAAARALGCPAEDPFMPLSFLPLTVIPSLKLSDRGLVDVDRFQIVPLDA
jgi:adenine deaminase